MNVEMLDKNVSILTYWDYVEDKPAKFVVKESFDTIMFKWEIAESTAVVFEEDEEGEEKKDNSAKDEDEED